MLERRRQGGAPRNGLGLNNITMDAKLMVNTNFSI